MSDIGGFIYALRNAGAAFLKSRTMRDIAVAYLIVLAALAASIYDAQAAMSLS